MRRFASLLAPLRSRDFRLVWVGQVISLVGSACSGVALVWLLVGLTGSSTQMGLILSASYYPALLLLLFGGAVADRYNGRVVALISDGMNALATLALALLVTLGKVTLAEVFVFSLLSGLTSAFFNPALSAFYPSLTDADLYDAAASLRQMSTQFATLIGPALAGYIIAQWSTGVALAVDAASFVVSFLSLSIVRTRQSQARQAKGSGDATPLRRGSIWRQMFAGFGWLRGEPGVLALFILFSLTNGLNDVEAVLVPRLARLDLKLTATEFGLLASCMGAGALIGALVAGILAPRMRWRIQAICGAMVAFGGAIAAMGLASGPLALDAAYVVMGAAFATPEVIFGGMLLRLIPAEARGRVFSLVGLIAMALNPPGLYLAGVLGDTVGNRAGLWIGGGAIMALAIVALLIPAVRALNGRVTPETAGATSVAL